MSQPVIIKSNRYGINLILTEELSFSDLLKKIEEKFLESEKFFHDATMALSFEGRVLSQEEELAIVNTITEKTSITIVCVIDQDETKEAYIKSKLEAAMSAKGRDSLAFYHGTLRSGQVLENEDGVVVLGDVNPGAKVVSNGNIVVLGALKGTAYAGVGGSNSCFVAALDMQPVQIQIGEILGRSADEGFISSIRSRKKTSVEPQLAMVSEGQILIEPISKNLLKKL